VRPRQARSCAAFWQPVRPARLDPAWLSRVPLPGLRPPTMGRILTRGVGVGAVAGTGCDRQEERVAARRVLGTTCASAGHSPRCWVIDLSSAAHETVDAFTEKPATRNGQSRKHPARRRQYGAPVRASQRRLAVSRSSSAVTLALRTLKLATSRHAFPSDDPGPAAVR